MPKVICKTVAKPCKTTPNGPAPHVPSPSSDLQGWGHPIFLILPGNPKFWTPLQILLWRGALAAPSYISIRSCLPPAFTAFWLTLTGFSQGLACLGLQSLIPHKVVPNSINNRNQIFHSWRSSYIHRKGNARMNPMVFVWNWKYWCEYNSKVDKW